MAYQYVQFVAHCIYTGPNFDSNGKQHYVGLDSPAEDQEARVALLEKAIQRAYQSTTTDQKVLKVFMLPEFFFRGETGAYMDVDTLFVRLKFLVKDTKWKDWLFVFGTILCQLDSSPYSSLVLSPDPANKNSGKFNKKVVANFAFVLRGGSIAIKERIIPKIIKTDGDFIKRIDTEPNANFLLADSVVHPPTINEYELAKVLQDFLKIDSQSETKAIYNNDRDLHSKFDELQKLINLKIEGQNILSIVRLIREASIPTKPRPDKSYDVNNDWQIIAKKVLSKYITSNWSTLKKDNILPNTFEMSKGIQQLDKNENWRKVLDRFLTEQNDEFKKQCNPFNFANDEQLKTFKEKLTNIKDIRLIRETVIPNLPKTIAEMSLNIDGEMWAITKKFLEVYVTEKFKNKNSRELLYLSSDPFQFILENSKLKNKIRSVPYIFSLVPTAEELQDKIAPSANDFAITFGLEICGDHSTGVLKKIMDGEYFSAGMQPLIDIQLISSGGMKIASHKIVAREGGYTFHCDGYNPNTSPDVPDAIFEKIKFGDNILKRPCSVVQRKGGSLTNEEKAKIQRVGVPSTDATLKSGRTIHIPELYAQGTESTKEGIIPQGAGQLHIYPPLPLPNFASSQLSLFPNSRFVGAMSNEPVLLNGMKVIFDQPVSVYPVILESKAEARHNGN